MIRRLLLLLLTGVFPYFAFSQTVGLLQYNSNSYTGYNLFTANFSTTTYLLDNCGRSVHEWPSQYTPGLSVYLLDDGSILRTAKVSSSYFSGGGSGGRVERIAWDGTLEWYMNYSDDSVHQHHDIEPLPNGNFLMIAWERHSKAEAVENGRDPSGAPDWIWSEQVIEVEPLANNQYQIVWEWHLWDHLVQDFDDTKLNYSSSTDTPWKVNINYTPGNGGQSGSDWIHMNAVEYDSINDLIYLSPRTFSEIWVIDHSTTSMEAAGSTGGTHGKGGDFLYRWGNPEAYGRGTSNDRILFGQHDPKVVPAGYPHQGGITIFNNGQGRPGPNYSSIDSSYSSIDYILPPKDVQGFFIDPGASTFGPPTSDWTYTATIQTDFFSSNVSGATVQPNGNVLICEGASGRFFEVDSLGNMVWEYINPVGMGGPVAQGSQAFGNGVFRVERYKENHPGLAGKNLSGGTQIELNPDPVNPMCITIGVDEVNRNEVVLNPIRDHMKIHYDGMVDTDPVYVHNVQGQLVFQGQLVDIQSYDTNHWMEGVYILTFGPSLEYKYKLLKISSF